MSCIQYLGEANCAEVMRFLGEKPHAGPCRRPEFHVKGTSKTAMPGDWIFRTHGGRYRVERWRATPIENDESGSAP